ncbi:MAG: hypothetical protein M3Z04_21890 [Chloroflexota bacterium]|nr:hypothetical protein [Chloroflexota bacterium]
MPAPTVRLTLPTDRETPPTVQVAGGVRYRVAYARAAETQAAADHGQDYAAIQVAGSCCAFVLCDGVSQSFFGDLAATYLGDALIAWLTDILPDTMDDAVILHTLTDRLQALTGAASVGVAVRSIPDHLPALLHTVLEEKRANGSESTFVCGRLDRPSPAWPAGRLVLAWLGDSRLRFWGDAGERTAELGATFLSPERWSSAQGTLGTPHLFVGPLVTPTHCLVTHLLAYSDGLSLLDSHDTPPPDAALQELIQHTGTLPGSDDVSLLDITFDPPLDLAAIFDRPPTPPPPVPWWRLGLLIGAGLVLLALLIGIWASLTGPARATLSPTPSLDPRPRPPSVIVPDRGSPPAGRIVFAGRQDNTSRSAIFILDLAHLDSPQLFVPQNRINRYPTWDNNGNQIAFIAADTAGDSPAGPLWVMNAAGQQAHALLPIVQAKWPRWSPHGSHIVYAAGPINQINHSDLFTVALTHTVAVTTTTGTLTDPITITDGPPLQITHNPGFAGYPTWVCDGKVIIFALSARGNGPSHLFQVNADGTGLTRLAMTPEPGDKQTMPAVSPDGLRLAFSAHVQAADHLYILDSPTST